MTPTDPPPTKAAEARAAAKAFVATLNPRPATTTIQDLLLLVSELVTNALRHAGALTGLAFGADAETLYVQVTDPSSDRPQQRIPDLSGGTGGFGWPLVLRLSKKTDIRDHPQRGKVILVAMAR
ncbi:ATP-binding protein [Streptomyces sp. NBC_00523]|uniref:ATP-binding protein n=1 Tax=unclassified Streptomyces TaxID=2593676 RepID=UPI002E81CA95|nr:ATP-binding protein [Streptomyces sp. NBC_00523]WUD00776.1 ATP-binding protein [Streptomyces sp. NBC_00523]